MAVGLDGDMVVISTTTGRRKARNLARDPRIGLAVFDVDKPYRSVDIRGTAELIEDHDTDPPPEPEDVRRLIIRVTPEKVTRFPR